MRKILYLVLCVLLMGACTPTQTLPLSHAGHTAQLTLQAGHAVVEGFALDTVIRMDFWGAQAQQAAQAAFETVCRLEETLSISRPQSDIAQLNAADGKPLHCESSTVQLLQEALCYYRASGGAFDPCLYRLKALWGFSDTPHVPAASAIEEALSACGGQHLQFCGSQVQLRQGVQCDLGGIAKGYIADCIIESVRTMDIQGALLDLGGNIVTFGEKENAQAFRIAVRDPQSASGQAAVLHVSGGSSIVTSGIYERSFEEDGVTYGHILDPRTGYPAQSDFLSVTVVSADASLADAMSTALFVLGEKEARELSRELGFSFLCIRKDGSLWISEDLIPTLDTDRTYTVADA